MAVFFISGDDESVMRSKTQDVLDELVGESDRSMMVDEFEGDEYELRVVVDAAQTMPFLTDKRVVVARDVKRFNADELDPLLAYLADPLPSTDLVLVGTGTGRMSKKLTDAVKSAGATMFATKAPTRAKDRVAWVREEAAEHGVDLAPQAASRIADQLGEEVGRLQGLLAVLMSTYGDGERLSEHDVEPFLGEAGGVPPWDFTDAIDAGRTTDALLLMQRMVSGGGRHPLQLMATLHAHYAKLARLDGSGARTDADAASAIGIKPGYPAKKALGAYRRLGGTKVQRAIGLLARADRDLRGGTDLDPVTVMEILVARLSKLAA